MKMLLPFIILVFVVSGCDKENINQGTAGFITQIISTNRILIGDEIYIITPETQIKNSDGENIKKSSLKLGMKVQPFYEGERKEGFLAKSEAKLLRVLVDEKSKRESVMIINVIHQLRHNEDEHFIITDVVHKDSEGAYIMNVMRRSNLDIGFSVTVDEDTHTILYMEA